MNSDLLFRLRGYLHFLTKTNVLFISADYQVPYLHTAGTSVRPSLQAAPLQGHGKTSPLFPALNEFLNETPARGRETLEGPE